MAEIRLEAVRKVFGETVAVAAVDDTFRPGTVTCLLGPSGCGKTTLLRLIAGLEQPTSGQVWFNDQLMNGRRPRKRDIGMVFQYPVVYRGMTVREDIELPLKQLKLSQSDRRTRIDTVAELLGLTGRLEDDVMSLDNGTRQKVAVARAVARRPGIVIFDEPVTNVDVNTKLELQRGIRELTRELGQTILYVTHDQTEAMTLADRIALMRDGRIVDSDSPTGLYRRPATVFGGWFLGNPGMNFLECAVGRDADTSRIEVPVLPAALLARGEIDTDKVTVGIRPERIRIVAPDHPDAVTGSVRRAAVAIGAQSLVTVDLPGATVKVKSPPSVRVRAGEQVGLAVALDDLSVFGGDEQRLDLELASASTAAS